jgi:hypothetical protein
MGAKRNLSLMNGWETIRYELLNTRICDMGLQIEGSPIDPFIRRLYRELELRKFSFRPMCYLTDSWGCPDQVPVIGIPFYLADLRLMRIEEEQTDDLESDEIIMMLLRHEAGHVINYGYRLFDDPDWVEIFGPFTQPYRDHFKPNPFSRQFVRHIVHHRYGRTYAQKHPDEDFAETFAVWLTPRSGWRVRYRNWPAMRKLMYVESLMKRIRKQPPEVRTGALCTPVEQMDLLLAEHYGQRADRYRAAAQGYVDDKLREVFPIIRGRKLLPAAQLFEKYQDTLLPQVVRWSELGTEEVKTLLEKLQDRAQALGLIFHPRDQVQKVMDITALATALAMNFAYTGNLAG